MCTGQPRRHSSSRLSPRSTPTRTVGMVTATVSGSSVTSSAPSTAAILLTSTFCEGAIDSSRSKDFPCAVRGTEQDGSRNSCARPLLRLVLLHQMVATKSLSNLKDAGYRAPIFCCCRAH